MFGLGRFAGPLLLAVSVVARADQPPTQTHPVPCRTNNSVGLRNGAAHASFNAGMSFGAASWRQQSFGHSSTVCQPLPPVPPICDNTGGFRVRRVCVTAFPVIGGYFGPYYGPYDSYTYAVDSQNMALRQQLDAVQRENAQLRQEAQDAAAVRLDVGPRGARAEKARAERTQQLMTNGARYFRSGKYAAAAERFRQAAEVSTDESSPLFLLAHSLFAARRYPQAVRSLREALKANPDWLLIEFDVRPMYERPEDVVAQLAQLAAEVEANPLDRDRLFLLGFELFITGQPDRARPILEQAARLEKNDAHLKPFFDYFASRDDAKVAEAAPPPAPAK